jgi:hypothetical protein
MQAQALRVELRVPLQLHKNSSNQTLALMSPVRLAIGVILCDTLSRNIVLGIAQWI